MKLIAAYGTDDFLPQLRGLSSAAMKAFLTATSGRITCTGTIKKIFFKKGFGYIAPADGGEDLFIHVKDRPGLLRYQVGDAVRCTMVYDDSKGKFKGTSITAAAS